MIGQADKVFVQCPLEDSVYIFVDCSVNIEGPMVTIRAGEAKEGKLAMLTVPLQFCHIWWHLPEEEEPKAAKVVAIKGGKDEPSE